MPLIVNGKLYTPQQIDQPVGTEPVNPEVEAVQQQPLAKPEPSFTDVFWAKMLTENAGVTTMLYNAPKFLDTPNVEGYNPFEGDGQKVQGYEIYADRFVGATSDEDVQMRKTLIDMERQQKEIISRSSGLNNALAGMSAYLLDPVGLAVAAIPVARGGMWGYRFGQALKGAALTSAGFAAGEAAREATLHKTTVSRTTDESVHNIAAAAIFGGVFGGAAGALSPTAREAGKVILNKAFAGDGFKIGLSEQGVPQVIRSAGAAEVTGALEREGLAYINNGLAKTLSGGGVESLASVNVRGVTSPFVRVRELTNNLFDHGFILNKHLEGDIVGDVAERLINQEHARVVMLNNAAEKLYLQHAGVGKLRAAVGAVPEGKMSMDDFMTRVYRAARDGDEAVEAVSEVKAAAKLYRQELDSVSKRLKEAGKLGEDLDPLYISRVYKKDFLVTAAGRQRWVQKVGDWFQTHGKDGAIRSAPLSRMDAERIAEESLDSILKESNEALALTHMTDSLRTGSKFDKSRTILMPDKDLEEFLVTDMGWLVTQYSKRAANAIQVTDALKRMGYNSFTDFKEALKAEKDLLLAGAKADKQAAKIQKDFETNLYLADSMHALALGTFRKATPADRYVDTLLNYQFTRLLGGVVLSSIPELAMAPFRFGFMNTLKHGYLPMIKDFQTAKLTKDQLAHLDVGLELMSNDYLRAIGDTNISTGRGRSEFDLMMSRLTDFAGRANGISYWTSAGRRLAGQVSSATIIQDLLASQTRQLTSKELERLAVLGINHINMGSILAQINKYMEPRNGSYISNIHMWTDEAAARTFGQAVQQDVGMVILKPGMGDLPLFARKSNLGRVLFQFKAFSSTATGKVLISGLQRRDATAMMGLMQLIAMGAVSQVVKERIQGNRYRTEDPEDLLLAGMSRSGVLGLVGTTALDIGSNLTYAHKRPFAGEFIAGQVFGPTGSLVTGVSDLVQGMSDGKANAQDERRALSLVPFNNIFYLQMLTNKVFPPKKKPKKIK